MVWCHSAAALWSDPPLFGRSVHYCTVKSGEGTVKHRVIGLVGQGEVLGALRQLSNLQGGADVVTHRASSMLSMNGAGAFDPRHSKL